ncbi:TonB-dependent receptor plug domain-containing protein [Phenylobacterium sp.]|uniref:TonB-dependent receptor n=1 Tax=Phenylobacterium sp. TaxID=1871053 RepID=UPI0012196933|nr:TonB-dependent receptor plug domain-containing protein [Phenylobacterium sp.]THD61256.1 MAG: TonB-dependent receptor [Phenylobacterium sp.]
MRHLFRSAAVFALAVASAAVAVPALAQTASGAPKSGAAADTSTPVLDELVVTATKREESLRDIPMTVSAVTANQLTATGPVESTGDLLRTIPGVRFNNLQAPNLSEISIRGSGTERATGADSGVGLFVNGAYAGSSTLGGRSFKNIDFFDLDRVEVLEGPQSALYGRNAEFGVVNIVLAKPKFEDSGYVDETYTDKLDQNRLIAVGNYAFNDELAIRLGAEAIGQTGGFYLNPDDNKYYDQTNGWLGRGQIRYKHGPLDVDLLVDAQDLKLPTFVSGLAIAPGTVTAVPLGYTSSRFSVPSNGINDTEQRVQRAQLLTDLDLGWATLTSTTMLTHSTSLQWYGAAIDLGIEGQLQNLGEAGVYPLSQVHTGAKDRTYYEDLHLGGTTLNSSLDWLAGIELMDQHDSNLLTVATSPCALTATASICGGTPSAPVCYALTPAAKPCPTPFPAAFGTVSFTPERYNSEAAYGSLRYKVGKFTLSGELRYTNDLKNATQYPSALFTNVPGKTSAFKFAADRTNYAATISYKLPGPWDDMLYVKTGTGYRAGGVNSGTSTPVAPIPFRPSYGDEDTTSYEVGFKGNITSHIYVTLDGYMSDTQNAITVINDGCAVTNICGQAATIFNINGGTIHANGIEAAINGHFEVAGGPLDVSVNGANQHAHFVAVDGTYAGLPIVGSTVAQIPEWTSSATLDYKHAITGAVDGFFHVTYNGQSGGGQDTVTSAAPFIPMSSITDVSLRTGVDYKKFEVAIFVQNLTDQTYKLLILQAAGVTNAVRYNQPRTVGLNVVYHW